LGAGMNAVHGLSIIQHQFRTYEAFARRCISTGWDRWQALSSRVECRENSVKTEVRLRNVVLLARILFIWDVLSLM
jgi:hypothetical protein